MVAAVLAAVTDEARRLAAHERQPSAGGKYVSHRLQVRVGSAAEAHALRARLRALDGVKTVLELDLGAPAAGDGDDVAVAIRLPGAAGVVPAELGAGQRRRLRGGSEPLIERIAEEGDAADEDVVEIARVLMADGVDHLGPEVRERRNDARAEWGRLGDHARSRPAREP